MIRFSDLLLTKVKLYYEASMGKEPFRGEEDAWETCAQKEHRAVQRGEAGEVVENI